MSRLLLLLLLINQTPFSVNGWGPVTELLSWRLPKRSPRSSSSNIALLASRAAAPSTSNAEGRRRMLPRRLLSSRNRGRDTPDIEVNLLRTENVLLRETIRHLEEENSRLKQRSVGKIILETFEGERFFRGDSNDFTDDVSNLEYGELSTSSSIGGGITLSGEEQLSSPAANTMASTKSASHQEELWCDVLDDGDQCPLEPTVSFGGALRDRAYWLVGLLIMQSLSGVILSGNEALLADHPVIIYYLTMMVGAGGNAGNQASVRVIRGLALGTLNDRTRGQFLTREFKMAGALSFILSLAGFCRAVAFRTPFHEAIAVTTALALIVFSSVCLGAILPLILEWLGIDPAHSSTTIQVVMDIIGVFLAVVVSRAILDGPMGIYLFAKLGFF